MSRLLERIRAVAFDLDGTLVDSAPDLAAAANVTLQRLGYAPLAEQRITALIGDGIDRLIEAALTASTGRAPESVPLNTAGGLFRRAYGERLFARGRVYPGVMAGLRALARAGVRLCCVTNKHSAFALPLLEAAELSDVFAFVLCADDAEQRKPKPDLLIAACERFQIHPQELLCVGDSRTDIAAARAARCPVAVVDYGYNHGRPLAVDGPDWIIGSITELVTLPAQPRFANAAV